MHPTLYIAGALAKRNHRVLFATCEYGLDNFKAKIKDVGAEPVAVETKGIAKEQDLEKICDDRGVLPFTILAEICQEPFEQLVAKEKPDVVLTDFGFLAPMAAARKFSVPLVVNLPGPYALLTDMWGMPDYSTRFSFLGIHVFRTRVSPMGFAAWTDMKGMGSWSKTLQSYISEGPPLLVQTVWGLDAVQPLLPNVVVTGPVLPPPADLRDSLAKGRPQLYKFVHATGLKGIVYVTTGSLVKLQKWQVEAIFNGLKQSGMRVVWSLKEDQQEYLPVKNDPQFYISKWTPQAELLQDPAVRVVITHCGWGGTLECVTAGKPVVTIPFFGDQPVNARLLVRRGAGEFIGKIPSGLSPSKNPYKEGDFTAATVCKAVTKIIDDFLEYEKAMLTLMLASRASGGAETAAQHVEFAAYFGTDHLKPPHFKGSSPIPGVLLAVGLGVCAAAGLVYTRISKR